MKYPTIHLNGTSKESLQEAYAAASTALHEAIRKLGECAPNGRDYYPQGDGAVNEAVREHRARLEAVDKVRQEIEMLWLHVEDQ